MYTLRCAYCVCYPEDCKDSNLPQIYPNCLWKEVVAGLMSIKS